MTSPARPALPARPARPAPRATSSRRSRRSLLLPLPPIPRRASPGVAVVVAALLGAGHATAQVPDGQFAIASAHTAQSIDIRWTGLGGVYVGYPRGTNTMQPIQGLSAELTGANCDRNAGQTCGANSIEIDPETDDLLVGQIGPAGTRIHIHRVTLNGLTVARTQTYYLGDATASCATLERCGGVVQTALLPRRQLVVAGSFIQGPIGNGDNADVGIVVLNTGLVIPILQNWQPPGPINAMAVDRDTFTVYFGEHNGTGGLSAIYSHALGSTQTPTVLATISGGVTNLAVNHDGDVVATCSVGDRNTMAAIYKIDVPSGQVTQQLTSWQRANAIAIEPATGKYIFSGTQTQSGTIYGVWLTRPNAGGNPPQLLSRRDSGNNGPPGMPQGITIAPDPRIYGLPTGADTLQWSTAPLGLPQIGNPTFRVRVRNPNAVPLQASLVVASLGPARLNLPGVNFTILIDPTQFVASAPFGSLTSLTFTLPIPSSNSLPGAQIFFQSYFSSANGFSATDGMRVTIL